MRSCVLPRRLHALMLALTETNSYHLRRDHRSGRNVHPDAERDVSRNVCPDVISKPFPSLLSTLAIHLPASAGELNVPGPSFFLTRYEPSGERGRHDRELAQSICRRIRSLVGRLSPMSPNNSRPIAIRPYVASDASTLTSLFRSSVREIASSDYTASQIREWAPDLIDEVRFGQKCLSRPTWVAEVGGHIAGFSDLEPDGHVDMLYVHPEFQRRGVARALLKYIEETARAAALRRLYTEASIAARPAFEALGFRTIEPQTVTIRGAFMTNYKMEKWLESPVAAVR